MREFFNQDLEFIRSMATSDDATFARVVLDTDKGLPGLHLLAMGPSKITKYYLENDARKLKYTFIKRKDIPKVAHIVEYLPKGKTVQRHTSTDENYIPQSVRHALNMKYKRLMKTNPVMADVAEVATMFPALIGKLSFDVGYHLDISNQKRWFLNSDINYIGEDKISYDDKVIIPRPQDVPQLNKILEVYKENCADLLLVRNLGKGK